MGGYSGLPGGRRRLLLQAICCFSQDTQQCMQISSSEEASKQATTVTRRVRLRFEAFHCFVCTSDYTILSTASLLHHPGTTAPKCRRNMYPSRQPRSLMPSKYLSEHREVSEEGGYPPYMPFLSSSQPTKPRQRRNAGRRRLDMQAHTSHQAPPPYTSTSNPLPFCCSALASISSLIQSIRSSLVLTAK
jgi:hypothetical protein